ncbi:MAG TPA: response regulator transcription factor [Archangium sp.]|jgi:DNA-binding NarL/FixJ family response regulator|uniref:response regulator transcription factor n=1 Tax=Archangium sp. TaxID=1872627 RepID=UPI002EDA4B39
MESGSIRLAILEDQQIFRESLISLFEAAGMQVVARDGRAQGFLAQVEETKPDVVLVDVRLESTTSHEVDDGLRVVEVLRERHPDIRSLVLTSYRDLPLLERCFQAGAAGYLCKLNVSCDEVVSAVERVARGEWLVPPEFVEQTQPAARDERGNMLGRLTLREREVLGFVASGADNLQIAARLDITERTVKAHVSNLYRKLGVNNRVEMAMLALQMGVPRSEIPMQHP